jgi:hypothetical protein
VAVHRLRWPAQPHAFARHHERPVDQDRVRHHRIQQRVIRQRRIVQPKFPVHGFLRPHCLAHGQPGARDQVAQFLARRRRRQVLDHARLDAMFA